MENVVLNRRTEGYIGAERFDDAGGNSETTTSLAGFAELIGKSKAMQDVYRLINRVADSDSRVIIYGESGTGKELVSRAIYHQSRRNEKPFVPINCGAIPENLLESELFGHVRGSFTGAISSQVGKFELAHEGTIFLDEIGDMSADLQVKMLRVLEQGEILRVGGTKPVQVDVRVIAATHRNLERAVEEGKFREDLFYRLHVIPVHIPPLRERRSDIPLLFNHFLAEFNERKRQQVDGISDDAMSLLMEYSWPGNVRELKNVIERMVILKGNGTITTVDLPRNILGNSSRISAVPTVRISEEGICLNTAVSEFEKALILKSLEMSNGVKNRAAKLLHLNRTTLVEKIKKHRLQQRCSA
ncbi:MAG TPA: sigma-54 dependent transcriptional regulator [Thermodesulfobacteriota bacterium]|nr:sigma-54 dependent transcriptional regulator [Thermodesulfobacteriota bacterium]HNU70143.1 sigma-54 dependent transcriptional regulator [Thermodesulfobacteriota bacterium]HOC38582.1 sigma-54 dependent transcriptional regulator [Thermodesulfobacteriota bacterium]